MKCNLVKPYHDNASWSSPVLLDWKYKSKGGCARSLKSSPSLSIVMVELNYIQGLIGRILHGGNGSTRNIWSSLKLKGNNFKTNYLRSISRALEGINSIFGRVLVKEPTNYYLLYAFCLDKIKPRLPVFFYKLPILYIYQLTN